MRFEAFGGVQLGSLFLWDVMLCLWMIGALCSERQ